MTDNIVNVQANSATSTVENGVEVNDLVVVNNNQAVTTSLKVAEVFGKEHFNVIRDIRNLIGGGVLKIEDTPMFIETTYVNEQNKQEYPMFVMDRDGFDLLVMGFTGEKALAYKVTYIKAFRAMSEKLREMSERETRLTSFIPPVSDGNNAIAQTIANLNVIKEDYARHVLCLEKYGYGDTGKFVDDFSDSFLNFRDKILRMLINEEIFKVKCLGDDTMKLLEKMRQNKN